MYIYTLTPNGIWGFPPTEQDREGEGVIDWVVFTEPVGPTALAEAREKVGGRVGRW